MCGIAGYVGRVNDTKLLERMSHALAHRGPDDEGFYRSEKVALVNRRLSIIDLGGGHQPKTNETETIWAVFNGEIYNFLELREELAKKGHIFKSKSDTEVIVHLYEEYRDAFAEHLLGMFAVALWDDRKDTLVLVRDHLGKKPLFYWYDAGRLFFASEVKAIMECSDFHPDLDFEALHYFLNCRWVPGEKTLFKDVLNLLPGHMMKFSRGEIVKRRYWTLELPPPVGSSEEDIVSKTQHLFKQAVRRRLISDVPLGVFLSGGIDSSSIVAAMSEMGGERVKTFTLGFNDPTDENEDARRVAEYFGTEHHELMTDANPLRFLPTSVWFAETPKVNTIQMYLISKFAREQVKVALSGLGGDELFGGYENYLYVKPLQSAHRHIPPSFQRMMTSLSHKVFALQTGSGKLSLDEYRRGLQMLLSVGDRTRYYLILRNVWDGDDAMYDKIYSPAFAQRQRQWTIRSHFERYFPNNEMQMLSQVMHCELSEKLVADQIWLEDRMTMATSLESRAPFLDKDLVEFAVSIPDSMKIRGRTTKYIFRKAMRGLVPEFVFDKPKWGFAFDPYRQFKRDLKETARRVLTRERIVKQGFFNFDFINSIIEYPPHRSMQWHYLFLWNMVGFQIWYDLFLTRKSSLSDLTAEFAEIGSTK
ncbi:asparagine synthase (glutamine-hydrolyzing) [bacterium]|nr:MAG: asparagine synthase (glutamine-hydrolyzing) [bacterium]